ncbi:MAG: ribosome small subunit-dependent GTPase A [Bacteroidetes bacterium]|nr:ribosome small subunit-dependent GTPase A [Bacteroidota bacterium]HET6243876.1 ribosome small subunit-dependent GTPase A [Bacteroidia bacterium]
MKGIVVKSTGSWYAVMDESRKIVNCRIKGKFRMQGIKSTNPIAVGDKVEFNIEDNDTGIISEIEKRKNYIIRKSINLSKQSHIIAANIDQAFLIATLVFPRTSTGFIDRFLVTAEAYNIPTIILFNKSDLMDAETLEIQKEMIEMYERIGYPCYVISALKKQDLEMLKTLIKDKTNLVSGHSGVGKSTLVNSLEPGLNLKTGEISQTHSKGMHTTTFAEMLPLSFGGFIIDTPGIKELGLIHIKKEELAHFFPEIRNIMHKCHFNNCRHVNEPKCAVKEAVEKGEISESRYYNYLSMYNSEELVETF